MLPGSYPKVPVSYFRVGVKVSLAGTLNVCVEALYGVCWNLSYVGPELSGLVWSYQE
ncbi:hypothetical protein HNQ94_002433 [Salirhabdus euzebyi]|uniref:Uncharacterized protein n=1 Tax=Salirhabdus euzebyi TaxID=394506 RepID=A0A841Q6Q2_9BACI|nr:hypothetical protein [Salirhabdus euzebyi]